VHQCEQSSFVHISYKSNFEFKDVVFPPPSLDSHGWYLLVHLNQYKAFANKIVFNCEQHIS